FEKGDSFGVVESVKSVNDVYSPLSGKIIEFNEPLVDSPELINEDPYGEGWMVKLALKDKKELGELMDSKAYEAFLHEEEAE
ncbi:MAG: glycine cleavage system protein H, partial [bacterium]|nr:glycine cleavage system protein H [bacterium]